MKFPPVIFFDLDDTIIIFGATALPLWQELCEAYEQETGELNARELSQVIRQTSRWFWSDKDRHREGRLDMENSRRQIVKLAFKALGNDHHEDAYRLADQFSRTRMERITLFPGARETLRDLQQRGIRLALITNGDASGQNAKIDRFHLRSYFENIFIDR